MKVTRTFLLFLELRNREKVNWKTVFLISALAHPTCIRLIGIVTGTECLALGQKINFNYRILTWDQNV